MLNTPVRISRRRVGLPFCLNASVPTPNCEHRAPAPRPVRVLPRVVVQRLAAGAVVNGPCDVVRELVENSLDANASVISVEVEPRTRNIIVSDDGYGISVASGLLRVAKCNATSKLRSVEDLGHIETLGFRGQGLWACASLAGEFSVASRTADAVDGGTRVRFASDGTVARGSVAPAAMAPGTIVMASKMTSLEFSAVKLRACKTWLATAALCHPGTSFSLKLRGKTVWSSLLSANATTIEAVAAMLGKPSSYFRSAVVYDDDIGRAEAVVGLPSLVHYSSASHIMIAVNGRCVELSELSASVRSVFRSALPSRRYPVVFAHLTVKKRGACDWNVHPMKKTMRVGGGAVPCNVAPLLCKALVRALADTPLAMNTTDASRQEQSMFSKFDVSSVLASVLDSGRDSVANDSSDWRRPGLGGVFSLRPIAQVMQTYIVAEYDTGLLLIEQHTAHERICEFGFLISLHTILACCICLLTDPLLETS
jgi:DNA mismatch repair protein MutL